MTAVVAGAAAAAPTTTRRTRGGIWRAILHNRKAMVGAVLFVLFCLLAAVPKLFVPWQHGDPRAVGTLPLQHPSGKHWLGTTGLGQDVYAELVYSTRESLIIALIAGLGATIISVLIGVSAAYLGGAADDLLSMTTDVFLVLPTFPLIIVLATYAGKGNLTVVIIVLVVTGWSYGARQLRAQALSLRNREFLESARVRGERSSYIIVVEVLPTMTSLILANFLGAALYSVLTAAGLQFLGLGDPNSLSWGTMLYWAQNQGALVNGLPAWALAPGLAVALLGVSFALLNYAFDEISNPALRPARRRRVKSANS
ncbi:MAG TPA: ABC transporter permease [Mycobacteriales bacterium]|jgi:peptide/nickel transport system permease protein|nr:ABC transporter permease [Mycobacteriales bacterium]